MAADITTRLREIAAGPDEGSVARAAVVDLAHECLEEIDRLRKIIAMWERCAVMTREAFGNCICPKEYP